MKVYRSCLDIVNKIMGGFIKPNERSLPIKEKDIDAERHPEEQIFDPNISKDDFDREVKEMF
jgi:hypothetical protein